MNPEGVAGEKIEELLARLLERTGGAGDSTLDLAELPGRTAECLEEAIWQRIASGFPIHEEILKRRDTPALIEHASGCRRCGAMLHYWTSIVCGEETSEESFALDQLASQSRGWQEQMTARLFPPEPAAASGFFNRWPVVLAVAGAVAAASLFVVFLSSAHLQPSPERLLAEAYSTHRVMEVRIPLAEFSALDSARHLRGAAGAAMEDSVPLLEARAAISQALMKAPEDAHWLLLQARADLLNEHYDPAIDTLNRLLAVDPENVGALTDLASAYMMRAKTTDAPTDEATALDYLEQAAHLDAKNPVVLYNEAVVMQELYQYSNAIDVWHRFLAVEHDRAWAEDGKRRLAEIEAREAKVKGQQSRLHPFLSSPEGMLHLARSPAVLADYDEELATLFLPPILTTAFPLSPPAAPSANASLLPSHPSHPSECEAPCIAARALLHAIAASLAEQHDDRWLEDLLAHSAEPQFAAAANLLAESIEEGSHANPKASLVKAQAAQSLFESSGNAAGVAAVRTVQIYDLEHLFEPQRCLAAAGDLPALLAEHRYPYFEAQFWADDAACHEQQIDFEAGTASLDRSLEISAAAGYRAVHLRALGFEGSQAQALGNRDLAWKKYLQVLAAYWSGNYPVIRLLQPYNGIAETEQASNRFFGALALRREALAAAAQWTNPMVMNENRFLLVKAEIQAGAMGDAVRDLTTAEAEAAALPEQEDLRKVSAETGLLVAESYLARNDASGAARALQSVALELDGTTGRDLELRYAAAAGRVALIQGEYALAEEKLSRAIALVEQTYAGTRAGQDRIDWIEGAREIYAAMALVDLREGKDPVQALATWERYRILSSGATLDGWCGDGSLGCLAPAIERTRRNLKEATVVGSLRLAHSLVVWTMDDRGIQMREAQIEPGRFDALCRGFFQTLAAPVSSEAGVRFYGERVASSLLTPVAGALDSRRTLIFDLDDTMEFLPAAALPVKDGYLGLQFATSTVHSLLLADRPRVEGSAGRGVVVGASDPGDPEVSRLPEARDEALAVAGLLDRPKVLVGDDALASSVVAAAPHAALLHFAGHTRYAGGATRLLLARPAGAGRDWLDAHSFRPQSFANCRLVVLSACSTGKREESDADGVQDIVQTLVAEGAQQIVATHWDVDSAASAALMKTFYAGLARGLTVPQALHEAETQESAMHEYRNPHFWASYYAIGMNKSNLKGLFHVD
jgi:CHAT domain-containing protein